MAAGSCKNLAANNQSAICLESKLPLFYFGPVEDCSNLSLVGPDMRFFAAHDVVAVVVVVG